ncbi:MAG: hypothetical protein LBU87_01570 [Lactobacillales bacterium]|nr:hypothetical protein [Lactobacillales bacterium]
MNFEILYYLDQWVIFTVSIIILFLLMELGYLWGKHKSAANKEMASHISGALIGFVALLLGFSFSMAINRFDARRGAMLQEVNDIQTAYQRIDLLNENDQTALRPLFKKYVDSRIQYYDKNPIEMHIGIQKGIALQNQIWEISKNIARQNPSALNMAYIAALGDMIGDLAKRTSARDNHVPEPILWLLFCVAAITITVNGYSAGINRERGVGLRVLLILSFMVVLILIIDLDRPRRGLIVNNQQPVLNLQDAMK